MTYSNIRRGGIRFITLGRVTVTLSVKRKPGTVAAPRDRRNRIERLQAKLAAVDSTQRAADRLFVHAMLSGCAACFILGFVGTALASS